MARKPKTTTDTQTTRVVTTSNAIRIEQPKSSRGQKPKVTVLVGSEAAAAQVGGFVTFLREHAVVGLAVGFIIGQQAQGLVKQLVDSFITPLASFVIGQNLKDKKFVIDAGGSNPQSISWGMFIYTLMNFLFVLAAIYIIIKFFKLDKLDKPKSK